jgi:hypothetical protein
MESWAKLFDPYNREARLAPAALMLSPILLSVFVVYPETLFSEFPKNALVMLVLLALAYLIAGFARSAGKRVEEQLHRQWGGMPTTAMLRHRDPAIDTVTKARYHRRLAEICDEIEWPSIEDENANPVAADARYWSAISALRARRRGDEHSNVLRENTQYGFRRNMYGLRVAAISIALIAALYAVASIAEQTIHEKSFAAMFAKVASEPRYSVLLFANSAIAIAWAIVVRQSWVYQAASDYARALLNTLDLA